MRRIFLRGALFLALVCFGAVLHAELALKGNERVIFIGDNVTSIGDYPIQFQQLWLLRYPGTTLTVINGGIAGEKVADALFRFKYDILPRKADVAFVLFGVNDVGRHLYQTVQADEATNQEREKYYQEYCKNIETLVGQLQAAGIKVVLMTPSCYDQYQKDGMELLAGCNEPGLARFAEFIRTFAEKKGIPCIDIHGPMTDIARKNTDFALCGSNRLQPGPAGALFMGILIAREAGIGPCIASVSIAGDQTTAENAQVTQLVRQGSYVKFVYAPKSLPLSLKTSGYDKLSEIFDIQEAVNQEILTIKDLPNGSYAMRTNGKEIAIFNAKELAAGVNLAILETPSAAKSAEIFRLSRELKMTQMQARALAFCDILLLRQNRVPGENKKGDIKFLEKWAEERQSKDFATRVVNIYKKYVENREQLQKNGQETLERMQGIRPEPFTIEIVPVQ